MSDCYWCGGTGTVLPEQGVTQGGQACKECQAGELKKQEDRLAAAAPELLQALENLEVAMNTFNYVWDKRPENMWKAMRRVDADLKAARAAIAKAKGIADAPT